VTQIMDVVTSELFFFGFLRFHRGEERGGGVVTGHNARAQPTSDAEEFPAGQIVGVLLW